MNELIINPKNYEYGLRCVDCDKVITYEKYVVRRYTSEDIAEIICLKCGVETE